MITRDWVVGRLGVAPLGQPAIGLPYRVQRLCPRRSGQRSGQTDAMFISVILVVSPPLIPSLTSLNLDVTTLKLRLAAGG